MLVDESPPSDDYPNGFQMNITHGIRRCSLRDESNTATKPLEPGHVYRTTITMYPTSNLFQKGHSLALFISSSSYPHFDVNPGTSEPLTASAMMRDADNTLWHYPAFPAHVVLPIVKGAPRKPQSFVRVQPSKVDTTDVIGGANDEVDECG
eukprot:CAMPEP_0177660560 /NCGR_PEP_ID=MMETSP0447-20121125/18115_1 /TAXON_ID=0 /ORGANISM="Stygamoeba regulata, Strain BSH-02190019" /LENGTH=150 /DNA_ID=CAMNT_0019165653 /DNA_START=622 /DNA_END=1074 /DNA_ORIENTATION=+